ncbi:MAG: hypothetical protein TEF_05895 [Rhizobiales bacterium NRL2]|jgi:inorganic triphosphatase YgiF|nr:MAG: hypothetical protein TEF_05895 [Rhizobiales bacterium NRL2]
MAPREAEMTDAPVEVEIKLTGPARVLKAALGDLGPGEAKRSDVVSVYHDTDDDRLWRKGFTFRLRDKGGEHILTLKREGQGELARGEWETTLDAPAADPGLLPAGAPRGELGVVLPEELSERHRTVVRRTKKIVEFDGAVIEASLDEGRIEAGDRRMPVGELELELLKGEPRAVLAAAEMLLSKHALALEPRSKAARGMELAGDAPPAWRKARKPALGPGDTVNGAIARILGETATQIMANIPAAADGRDPEGVHQLRVALRRLRSAFKVFGKAIGAEAERLDERARPVLKALGPARDLDVFLAETLPPVAAAHGEARGLKLLTEAAEARQAAAYEAVRALCAGRELSRLVVAVMLLAENMAGPGDWSEPLPAFAARVLDKRFRKARKKGRDFETMPTAQRHEVRIAVKKFRYALDFFQSLYPDGRIGTFRESLRALQDDLGRMNDATVAEGLAEDLAAGQPEAMVGAALVKGWYTHRLKAVEPHMIAAWNDFRATAPFWRE